MLQAVLVLPAIFLRNTPHCPRTCIARNSAGDSPAFCNAANAPGVATSLPRRNSGRRSIREVLRRPSEPARVTGKILAPKSTSVESTARSGKGRHKV